MGFPTSSTPPRTASGQNVPFQIVQSPNMVAMWWSGWLNASTRSLVSHSVFYPFCPKG